MIAEGTDQNTVATYVVDLWTRLKSERLIKEAIWDECFRAHNSQFGATWLQLKNYRSKRYLPASNQAVENVTSHVVQGVIPHDDWLQILGRTPDDDASTQPMAELLKWQHYKTHFESEFTNVIRQASICGQAPWSMTWTSNINSVPDQAGFADSMGKYAADVALGNISPETKVPVSPQMDKVSYDGPALQSCSIYDYVQDRQRAGSAYPGRIIRSHSDKAHLLEWAKPSEFGHSIYENVEDLNEQTTVTESSDSLVRAQHNSSGFVDNPKDAIELLEFWGDLVIDGKLYKNHVAVVANKKTLIRFEPNPFSHGLPPWNMFVLQPKPNETYGEGCLECALDLQDAINVRFNQVIDANSLAINNQFKAKNNGTIDPDNFISAPGMIHFVENMDDLQPLSMPSNSSLGFQEIGFLLAQFNEATNAMKAFTTADYQKSATEVGAISGMIDSRFAHMVKHIERTFVMPAIRMQMELNQQLMEESIWVRVVENQNQQQPMDQFGQPKPVPMFEPMIQPTTRLKIEPKDIQGEFDIYPVGAQWVSNNQAAMGALGQMLQVLGGIPPAAESIRWDKLASVMFRAARIPQSWNLIKTPQEISFDKQQQQQQQMQLAAQSSGQQPGQPQQGGPGPSNQQAGSPGVQSMAGIQSGGAPPTNPGSQQTPGGPQTS